MSALPPRPRLTRPQRPPLKPRPRWSCGCTPEIAEIVLEEAAGCALADASGGSDHHVAVAIEHLIAALAGATGKPNLAAFYAWQKERDHAD